MYSVCTCSLPSTNTDFSLKVYAIFSRNFKMMVILQYCGYCINKYLSVDILKLYYMRFFVRGCMVGMSRGSALCDAGSTH